MSLPWSTWQDKPNQLHIIQAPTRSCDQKTQQHFLPHLYRPQIWMIFLQELIPQVNTPHCVIIDADSMRYLVQGTISTCSVLHSESKSQIYTSVGLQEYNSQSSIHVQARVSVRKATVLGSRLTIPRLSKGCQQQDRLPVLPLHQEEWALLFCSCLPTCRASFRLSHRDW